MDIVERLRKTISNMDAPVENDLLREAADEIERMDRLWTAKEVAEYLRVSYSTFMRLKHRDFPKPAPLPGHPRWVPERVREWADSQNAT